MQLIDLLERHAAICHLLQKLGITDLLRSRTVYGRDCWGNGDLVRVKLRRSCGALHCIRQRITRRQAFG